MLEIFELMLYFNQQNQRGKENTNTKPNATLD